MSQTMGRGRCQVGSSAQDGPVGVHKPSHTHTDARWVRATFSLQEAEGGLWCTASPVLCCPSHCRSFLPFVQVLPTALTEILQISRL